MLSENKMIDQLKDRGYDIDSLSDKELKDIVSGMISHIRSVRGDCSYGEAILESENMSGITLKKT